MYYRRVTKGLEDRGTLAPLGEEFDLVKDPVKDYYVSLYYYNEAQKKVFDETSTVSGIIDVTTPYLFWDFDSTSMMEQARKDAVELCSRLASHGVHKDDINIFFSGKKGFAIELLTDRMFSPDQFKNITAKLAEGLETRDSKIINPSRVVRVPNTKHQDTGLYKRKLTLEQLSDLSSESIKDMAKDLKDMPEWTIDSKPIPDTIVDYGKVKIQVTRIAEVSEIDYSRRPKNFPACKWRIQEGDFTEGSRNDCLTALAAHYKAQGFNKDVTYNILKAAARNQHQRYPNEVAIAKDEIWNTVIKSVYGPMWQGKTYSCKNQEFLKKLCPKGHHNCQNKKTESITSAIEMADSFDSFAKDLEKNLIKTGIPALDNKLMLLTSTSVGLLGAPGSGKTAMVLKILANLKESGSTGLFCSLDMGKPIVFLKMAMNVSGKSDREIIQIFKSGSPEKNSIKDLVKEKYGSLPMTFRSGQSVSDIRELVLQEQDRRGEKIKLVAIDYLELINGPYSDPTANSAMISSQLKDLSTDLETCVITLVQPQKSAGDASEPLLSMRRIKGASALEQNFRTVLGIYREGFNPNKPEEDQFITINCLKNTLGGLFSLDFGWHGSRGEIYELTDADRELLDEIRARQSFKDSGRNEGW